jgi:hypothetical protein
VACICLSAVHVRRTRDDVLSGIVPVDFDVSDTHTSILCMHCVLTQSVECKHTSGRRVNLLCLSILAGNDGLIEMLRVRHNVCMTNWITVRNHAVIAQSVGLLTDVQAFLSHRTFRILFWDPSRPSCWLPPHLIAPSHPSCWTVQM